MGITQQLGEEWWLGSFPDFERTVIFAPSLRPFGIVTFGVQLDSDCTTGLHRRGSRVAACPHPCLGAPNPFPSPSGLPGVSISNFSPAWALLLCFFNVIFWDGPTQKLLVFLSNDMPRI